MRLISVLLGFFLAACSGEQIAAPVFHAEETPGALSEWGMVRADSNQLIVSDGVTPYDLATPLFSDYALKLRTVWLPDGHKATYTEDGVFDFPVGTVITKTFYYKQSASAVEIGKAAALSQKSISLDTHQLVETRILARRDAGWVALPYIWNADQSDAFLKRTGDIMPLSLIGAEGERTDFTYLIPNQNECAACHATNADTKQIQPIGLKARHLNKPSAYSPGFNQLDHWLASDILAVTDAQNAPANAVWTDQEAALSARARAYLDINCSHCHNPDGAANTSGLNLEPDAAGPALGVCKAPIAAGGGTGGRRFAIAPGAPDASILLFRMETTDPAAMMPELGRALAHDEGVALIRDWIAKMDGRCG